MTSANSISPLQVDLVDLLEGTRSAEHAAFGALPVEAREAPGPDGGWSPKDILAHLAAWRAIEARRLDAAAGISVDQSGDPPRGEAIDATNAMLHDRYADWPWDAVAAEADASIDALVAAIGRSSSTILCECDGAIVGIGANGPGHAIGHLPEIAELGGAAERFHAFARQVEEILGRGHVPPSDVGVILYDMACGRALSGDLDETRRLLRAAFSKRADLAEFAQKDPDLIALRDELTDLV